MDRRDFLKVVGAGSGCLFIPFSGGHLFPKKPQNSMPVSRISIDCEIGYRLPYRRAGIRFVEFPVEDVITLDTADYSIRWTGFNGCLQNGKLWDFWNELVVRTIHYPYNVYAESIEFALDGGDDWIHHPLRLWWDGELIESDGFRVASIAMEPHSFAELEHNKNAPVSGHVQSITYGTNVEDWFEQPVFFWEGIAPTVVEIEERFTNDAVREVEGLFHYKEILEVARKYDMIYQPHYKFCHSPYKWSMPFTIGGEVAHFELEHITSHSVESNIFHG